MRSFITTENLEADGFRTKFSHPYSYDPIIQFERKPPEGEKIESAYSDRMFRWNSERFRALQEQHFGNQSDYWESRSPETIEGFLRDYFNSPCLLLTKVVEHCNQATGYPVWQFFYVGRDTSKDT